MHQPRTLLSLFLLAAALASSACVLAVETRSPADRAPVPAPPPHPGPLTRDEVAHIAARVAQDHGYHEFRIEEMEREDDQRWEVEIAGWLGSERGDLAIVIDGWDGRVLKAKDHRDHHDEDDDED